MVDGDCVQGFGRPSPGVCEACPARIPIDQDASAIDEALLFTSQIEAILKLGVARWDEVHLRPWSFEDNVAGELAWLEQFERRIRCAGCLENWIEKRRCTPPDLTSRMSYFRWGVDRHDEVNVDLGRPVFGHAAALKRHSAMPGRPLPT
jgi:hypothetical protein